MKDKTLIHRLQEVDGFFLLPLRKENLFTLHLVKNGFVRNLHFSQNNREELKDLQKNGRLLGFTFNKDNQLVLKISSSPEEDITIRELSGINPFAQFSINRDGFHSFGITPVESEPFTNINPESIGITESESFKEIWKETIIKGELEGMEKKKNPPKM